nr:MAG TPA: hypothetical protein [Caudoviricetes sp.]
MSATYNPVSQEKEEGNRLGYYYNEDNLPFTKANYLNIKNQKTLDAEGNMWDAIPTNDGFITTRDAEEKYLKRGDFDGVVINNVRDYGDGSYDDAHTVYECIDNS